MRSVADIQANYSVSAKVFSSRSQERGISDSFGNFCLKNPHTSFDIIIEKDKH